MSLPFACPRPRAAIFGVFLLLSALAGHASEGVNTDGVTIPPGMSASFVRDEGDVAVIDFTGSLDRYISGTTPNTAARAVLAREFLRTHADDYDFIFFFSLFDYEMTDALAFHQGVQNTVQGIGLPLYDNSAFYNSDGRLLGTIDMGAVILDDAKTDPTNPFHDKLLTTVMHEILHQWGVRVDFIDPDTGERSQALKGHQDAHWSTLVNSGGSVEYGGKWLDNGDGTFTNVAERLFYNPMDLYLMGMAPPEEVPPFFLIENSDPAIEPDDISSLGKTVSGTRKDITVYDIIAAEGPRQPAAADAQKTFNAAFVLVKRVGQEVRPEVFGRIDRLRETAAQRFSILTGGRGIMHVHSRVRASSSVGEQDAVTGDAGERSGEYRLADALAWLRSAQLPAGNWQDRPATSLRDSLLANTVLASADPLYADARRHDYLGWIEAVQVRDNDGRARLVAEQIEGASTHLAALRDIQGVDGGWGISDQHESSPLDTALVVRALAAFSGSEPEIAKGVGYLLATQNADGGWGAVAGGSSQVGATVEVVRTLSRRGDVTSVLQAGSAWLAAQQQADGSFGTDSNRVAATAQVLWALADAGGLAQIDMEAASDWLRARQGANGSWDNSVYNTAVAVNALNGIQLGNWTVTAMQGSAETLYDGERLTLTATITNDGNTPTPGTTVALYLGDPANGGVRLDTLTIPTIGIGQAVDVTFYWDSFGNSGDQTLYLVIDPDNTENERVELDNVGSLPVIVSPPVDGVDLIPGDIGLLPGSISSLPVNVGLSSVIRNIGTQDAGNVEVQWWVDDAAGSHLLQTDTVAIPARGDAMVTTSYTWSSGGSRTFRIVVDPANVIAEANENNNQRSHTQSPEAGLDLAITDADIVLLNTPAFGQTLDATVTVHNAGTVSSPTFNVDISVEGTDIVIPLDSIQMTLAAGEARQLEVPWLVDREGALALVARIDTAQAVAERSEDNNEARRAFNAEVVEGSNLRVSHDGFVITPTPLLEGMGASLQARVINTGSQPAENVVVHFYDGKPGSGGVLIDEVVLPMVSAAGESTAMGVWPDVAGNYDRVLYVVVDPGGVLDEFDETDNTAFQAIAVTSLPDLALENGAVTLSPPMVAAGEAFSVTIDVANIGRQAVQAATVSLYWDSPDSANLLGEQSIDLPGGSSADVSFDLVADTLGERDLVVVVDAADTIAEQREDNNRVTRRLVVQDGAFYIDNPFISPNGDGEKDQVNLVFRMDYSEGSYLAVESLRGSEVLRVVLSDASNGAVSWDGRNALGGIVDDGTYYLVLRSAGGGELARTTVVVDNNRAPLTHALLDPDRGFETSLTCNLPNDPLYRTGWALTDDEQRLFFDKNDSADYPGADNGIYAALVGGDEVARLALLDDYPGARSIAFLGRNRAGNRVVFSVSGSSTDYQFPVSIYEKQLGDSNPPVLLMEFLDASVKDVVYGADDATPYLLADGDQLALHNAATGALLKLYPLKQNFYDGIQYQLVPNRDHSRALVNAYREEENNITYVDAQFIDLLDMTTGSVTPVLEYVAPQGINPQLQSTYPASAERFFCAEEEVCDAPYLLASAVEAVWSDDGLRFAMGGAGNVIRLLDANAAVLAEYPLPQLVAEKSMMLEQLVWSPDGTRLAFYYGGSDACASCESYGGNLHILNVQTGEDRVLYPYYHYEQFLSFHLSTWDGEAWQTRTQTHHPEGLAERVASLREYLPDADGRYRVRITQVGRDEAFVDQLSMLTWDGRDVAPASVKMIDDQRDLRSALSKRDRQMVDFHNRTVEVEWSASEALSAQMSLFAQESSPAEMKLRPFEYPDSSSKQAFSVPLGSSRSWQIDGQPEAADVLGSPLFSTLSRPDSAHRAATVRGYAANDDTYLYAALDFAVDSTEENRGDWAALEVRTADGWKRFVVDAENDDWGAVAYTRTPDADWGHRYYEFRIPLAQLGLDAGGIAQVRFQGYGSAGVVDGQDGLTSVRPLLWLPSDDALLYKGLYSNDPAYVLRFTEDSTSMSRVEAMLDNEKVMLSPRKRRLLYPWTPGEGTCSLDAGGGVVEQLHALDTLDNLVVDLRVLRTPGARGFAISGTVTDINFDHFTLMYSANGRDGWQAIRPAGAKQFIDEPITSWVPPEPGRYFVRLTGYDKAGNSISAIRQVVWSEQSPVTDIYLDQDLFSPNADGNHDSLGIHFRVRSPINLSVQVYAGDVLVRSLGGAYDLVGEDVWLYWDGRDSSGRVVPDGEYRVVIMGVEYIVQVDNTYPSLTLGMSTSPYGITCARERTGPNLLAGVSVYTTDDVMSADRKPCTRAYKGDSEFLAMDYLLVTELAEGDRDLVVTVESSPAELDDWTRVGQAGGMVPGRFGLAEDDITGRRFRARARDAAGNESVVEYLPTARQGLATILRSGPYQGDDAFALIGPEFALLGEPVPYSGGEFGDINNTQALTHITISETLVEPVTAVFAEFRGTSEQGWQRDTVTDFLNGDWELCKRTAFDAIPDCETSTSSSIDDDRIHLLWDMRKLQPAFQRNQLRFVLVTAQGEEIATPVVYVAPRTFSLGGFREPLLLDQARIAVYGQIYAEEALEQIAVYIRSEDDFRYQTEQLLGSVPHGPVGMANSALQYEVDASQLKYCTTYSVRAVMRLLDGNRADASGVWQTPCLDIAYRVEYPTSVHELPQGDSLNVIVWPVTLSDVPLKSLEIYAELEGGGKDVVATANSIDNGEPTTFPIDIAEWPSGEVPLMIRLVDDLDRESVKPFSLYKDVMAPTLEMPAPLQGQLVCGQQPLQISYLDSTGPTGAGQLPAGWRHEDRIFAAISGGSTPLHTYQQGALSGAGTIPRAVRPALPATGGSLEESDFAVAINVSEVAATAPNMFGELLIEALSSDGTVLQGFPVWDAAAMPSAEYPDITPPQSVDRRLVYRDYLVLPWRLDSEDGGATGITLRVTGTDAYGNISVLHRDVEMDAAAATPDFVLDTGIAIYDYGSRVYISPNDDGVLDAVTARISNYEAGQLELRLYHELPENDTPIFMGVVYRNDAAGAGDYAFEWDGRLDGIAVADGVYRIEPVLRDGCGNSSDIRSSGEAIRIVVDTQAPVISSVEPADGSPVALTARLSAVVEEPNLDAEGRGVRQFYRAAGSTDEVMLPQQIQKLVVGRYQVEADWNTYGLSGPYELVWRVSDLAGNLAETLVPVAVQAKADLLSSLEVDTLYVSPNGDGRLDQLRYRIGAVQPVNVTVTLKTLAGVPEGTLFSGTLQPGDNTLLWNGLLGTNQVADGAYQLHVVASSVEFPSLEQEASQQFMIDTTAPAVILPPLENGFLKAPFALKVSISDDAMAGHTVSLESSSGIDTLAEGTGVLADVVLRTLAGAELEGAYVLAVEASDLAGNRAQHRHRFDLDVTPPTLTWLQPQASVLGGEDADELEWSLSAEEPYAGKLVITLVDEHAQVVPLHEADGSTGEIAGDIEIGALHGDFILLAEMTDLAGNETRLSKPLSIDHQAPRVVIDAPVSGSFIVGDFSVSGSIDEEHLERWALSIRDRSGAQVHALGGGGTSKQGMLGEYSPPADGAYELVLDAVDVFGQSAETTVPVQVDTVAPIAPSGLSIIAFNGNQWQLGWQPSTSTDVDHYVVYDRGQPFATNVADTEFVFSAQANQPYSFTVAAVDHAGLMSEPSQALAWTLDTQGPTVAINSPAASALVGGLVDVIGTVAAEDLANYILDVAPVMAPGSWQQISAASLPRLGERIGQWNTLDSQGDGEHMLRLRAYDHNGNMSETTSVISVDNSAPEAPLSIDASVDDADVTLTWTGSPSSDVQGYLLMRNDRIVNAPDIVIGDVSPWLIGGNTYLDAGVVDGTHVYTLYAVDRAGNVSPPVEAAVNLDRRAPEVNWVMPEEAGRFENALVLHVDTDDEDIALARFRYRAAGDGTWTDIYPDSTSRPYIYGWDTQALPHGSYELQAQVWDSGGQTGLTTTRSVTKTDITPPLAPGNLRAVVAGGEITLTWLPSASEDLDRYILLLRDDAGGAVQEIAQVQSPATSYQLNGMADGIYHFIVVAQDDSGNQSVGSAITDTLVFTPVIDSHDSIVVTPTTAFTGHVEAGSRVEVFSVQDGSRTLMTTLPVDQEGRFSATDVPLVAGASTLILQAVTDSGDRSHEVALAVLRVTIPGKVRDLGYAIPDPDQPTQVLITWLPPENTPDASYLVRDAEGVLLHPEEQVHPVGYTSSSGYPSWGDPGNAFDDNEYSWFEPYDENWVLDVTLDGSRWVSAIEMDWGVEPAALELLGNVEGSWQVLGSIMGDNASEAGWSIVMATPQPVSAIRLVARGVGGPAALASMQVTERLLSAESSFDYESALKEHSTLSVAAINRYGVEGEAELLDVQAGDWVAPEAVTLSATVQASSVLLEWSPSASTDVDEYLVYRDGQPVASVNAASINTIDENVVNGVHNYQVRPVDLAGNLGGFSNLVVVTVAVEGPPSVAYVDAFADPLTGCIALSWPEPVGGAGQYLIYRSSAGGTTEQVAAVTDAFYNDCDLYPDNTYQYQVVVVDAAGNSSAPSSSGALEAEDQQPPATPSILVPVEEGETYQTGASRVTIAGRGGAGDTIALLRNGFAIAETAITPSSGNGEAEQFERQGISYVWLSENATSLAVANRDESIDVLDWKTQALVRHFDAVGESWIYDVAWLDDTRFALLRIDENAGLMSVEVSSVESGTSQTIASWEIGFWEVRGWRYDRGLGKIILLAQFYLGESTELMLIDPETGDQEIVLSAPAFDVGNPKISPSGQKVLWGENVTYIRDIASGQDQMVVCPGSALGWMVSPEHPVLYGLDGIISCDSDGTEERLLDYIADIAEVNDYSTFPAGIQFLLRENPKDGYSVVRAFDGESLAQVGQIPGDGSRDPYVEGISLDDRIWFTWWDSDTDTTGLWLSAAPINFTFPDVKVGAGLNEFRVVARDRFDNESDPSGAIYIHASAEALSNLSVSLASVDAVAVGQSAPVTVTVENTGNVAVPGTDVKVTVYRAGVRDTVAVEAVPPLDSGASWQTTLSWDVDTAVITTFEARIDTGGALNEAITSDNYAAVDVRATVDQNLYLTLSGTDLIAKPGEVRAMAWQLANPGVSDYQGDLVFAVESIEGDVLKVLAEVPVSSLPAAGSVSGRQSVTVPAFQPGDYRIKASFVSTGADNPVHALATLNILPDVQLSAVLSGVPQSVSAHQTLGLNIDLAHVGVSGLLQTASLETSLEGPDGSLVQSWQQLLASFLPGDSQRVVLNWDTGSVSPGNYTFRVSVRDANGALMVERHHVFTLEPTAGIAGTLELGQDVVGYQKSLPLLWQVSNLGNISHEDITVQLQVLRPGNEAISLMSTGAALPVATSTGGNAILPTSALTIGEWKLVLVATSSVGGAEYVQQLASASFSVRDIEAPQVVIDSPASDGVINSRATALSAHAQDLLSGVMAMQWRVDGGEWSDMTTAGAGFSAGLSILPEGNHTLAVRAVDGVGNVSPESTVSITVDNTAPQVQIAGVEGGGFYAEPVEPIVTISDSSALTVNKTLGGVRWSGEPVLLEGSYQLVIDAMDEANNHTRRSLIFTLDMTPPAISFSAVTEGGLYNSAVTPGIEVTDVHAVTVSASLDGAPYVSGEPVTTEGSHTLVVTATDLAGNRSQRNLSFSIDSVAPEPPVITSIRSGDVFSDTHLDVIGTSEPLSTVTLEYAGLTLTAQADGAGAFGFSSVQFAEGMNLIELAATDSAGNMSGVTAISFAVQPDVEPPVISISGVEEGGFYAAAVVPQVSISDASAIASSDIRLNDIPYTPGVTVTDEGTYVLRVSAEDEFGNRSEGQRAFAIDTSSPVISVSGIADGEHYHVNVQPVIEVQDNSPVTITVLLDGELYVPGTEIASEGEHVLWGQAVDAAGNSSVKEYHFTLDFAAPLPPVIEQPVQGSTVSGPAVQVVGSAEPLSTVELLVDGMYYTTVADAAGAFTWVLSLPDAEYELVATAVDRAGNASTQTIRHFMVADTEISVLPDEPDAARILLWQSNPLAYRCIHHPGEGQDWHLEALLRLGYAVTNVESESAFRAELASGKHTVIMIVGPSSGFGLPLEMSDDTIMRVRGGVASGMGLIWINTLPNLLEPWHDMVGARTDSQVYEVSTINYVVDAGNTLAFNYLDKATGIIPRGGVEEGEVKPDCSNLANWWLCYLDLTGAHYPAAVSNQYGRGATKMLTFDPAAIADEEAADAVLADVVEDVRPSLLYLPYVPKPAGLTISRDGVPAPIKVTVSVPQGMRLLPDAASEVIDARTASWLLDSSALTIPLQYRLAIDVQGEYSVGMEAVDATSGAILYSQSQSHQLGLGDQQLVQDLVAASTAQAQARPWSVALALSKTLVQDAALKYSTGRYEDAYHDLYWAMVKLRLYGGYDRSVMALMGDFQRVLISRM